MRGLVFLLLTVPCLAQTSGAPDPEFKNVDFDRWLGERHQAHLHFSGAVSRTELSFHQRLISRVLVGLDGRDVAARRGAGQLIIFLQITDRNGARYQSHRSIDLSKVNDSIETTILDYSRRVFFLPGDYRLAIALFDTQTGEHSARQSDFHIEPLLHDVLPDAWHNLPPVEFIENEPSPDGWYLPKIRGRLHWDAAMHVPPRIDVVLNVAPSALVKGARPTPNSGLFALLPTLKALFEIGPAGSERVELLDLARRRVSFLQDHVHELDWPELKASLGEANTVSIDVHSLAERHQDAQFFVSEIRKLLRTPERPRVLVVLTTSVAFEPGEDLKPIDVDGLPPCAVVVIRYHAIIRERSGQIRFPLSRNRLIPDVTDQLEATLEPLHPKVFDVETPEQMRAAIAEIEKLAVSRVGY